MNYNGDTSELLSNNTVFLALILTVVAEIVTILFALLMVKGVKEWKNLLLIKNFSFKHFLMGIGIGVLFFILLQVFSNILNSFGFYSDSSDTSARLDNLSGLYRVMALALFVPIIVPFIEEVFFRGYTLNFIRLGNGSKRKRTILAISISSVYFSLMHFQGFATVTDIFVLFWTALIAVVNALLTVRYNSIFPAFGTHLAYNGVGAMIMLFGIA